MRHPAGLYLAVKLDKTVYNGSERGEGGGGRGQGALGGSSQYWRTNVADDNTQIFSPQRTSRVSIFLFLKKP